MKSNLLHAAQTLALGVLIAANTGVAVADDHPAADVKTTTGTIGAINAKDKVLKLQGMLFSRTFVLGDNCALMTTDLKSGSLADFRPGEKVDVNYRNVAGVLIASSVTEVRLSYAGTVTAFNPANHVLTIQHNGAIRSFQVADNCGVILNNNAKGVLENVQVGNQVTVIYETPNGQWTARRIEQPSLQFTGSLDAIHVSDRTISAGKKMIGDKEFHLAKDCAFVNNGVIGGRIQDLKLGRTYELSYTTVNGVNVVTRIAPAPPTDQTTGTTQQSAGMHPPM